MDTYKNRYLEYKPTNEVVTKLWFMNQWKYVKFRKNQNKMSYGV